METAGGYAKEMGEDFARRQREHVTEALKKIDIVICTALIPGRKAPMLITEEMVAVMRPGSVIVDLAVEQGGNVEGSEPGEIVTTANGVKIVGPSQHAVAHRGRCEPALRPQSARLSRASSSTRTRRSRSIPRTKSSRRRC